MSKVSQAPATADIGDWYYSKTASMWYINEGGTWKEQGKEVYPPGDVVDEGKFVSKLDYHCPSCGYTNHTAKSPCGQCSAFPWYTGEVYQGGVAELNAVGQPPCAHCGNKMNSTKAFPCGECQAMPWHVIEGEDKEVPPQEGKFGIVLNTKDKNTDPSYFDRAEDGRVLVTEALLTEVAQNLDRLREARDEQRSMYRKTHAELAKMSTGNATQRRSMQASRMFKEYEVWLNQRRTLLDGGQPRTKAAIAQRKRRSNENAVRLLKGYARVLGFEGIESLIDDEDAS